MKKPYYTACTLTPASAVRTLACRLTFTTEEGILSTTPSAGKNLMGIWADGDEIVTVNTVNGAPYVTVNSMGKTVSEMGHFPAAAIYGSISNLMSFFHEGVYVCNIPLYMENRGYAWSDEHMGWIKDESRADGITKRRETLGLCLETDKALRRLQSILQERREP